MEYRKLIFPINKEEERVGACNSYKRQTASIRRFDYGIQITSRSTSSVLTRTHRFHKHFTSVFLLLSGVSASVKDSELRTVMFFFNPAGGAVLSLFLCL